MCVSVLWEYMLEHTEECIDSRGKEYLDTVFLSLAKIMESHSPKEAVKKFQVILKEIGIEVPIIKERDYDVLKKSVNLVRLKNNPIKLTEKVIEELYRNMNV